MNAIRGNLLIQYFFIITGFRFISVCNILFTWCQLRAWCFVSFRIDLNIFFWLKKYLCKRYNFPLIIIIDYYLIQIIVIYGIKQALFHSSQLESLRSVLFITNGERVIWRCSMPASIKPLEICH